MSSTVPSPMQPASATRRGTQSAAHFAKLEELPEPATLEQRFSAIETQAHDPVTLDAGNPAGWLDLAGQVLTLALVSASNTVAGVVDTAAQTFAGVKTFAAEAVFSAGLVSSGIRAIGASLLLRSALGASSGDRCVVIGPSTADGSVHASAKLLSVRTGIGGTEVESLAVYKGGILGGGSGFLRLNDAVDGAQLDYASTNRVRLTGTVAELRGGSGGTRVFSFASDICVRTGSANAGTAATTKLHTFADGMGSSAVDKAAVTSAGEFESLVNGAGIILKSPDGTRYRITVADGGTLTVAPA